MTAPQPKPWIMGIAPYVPGRSTTDDGRKVAKLSSNENPLGTSDAARAAFASGFIPALRGRFLAHTPGQSASEVTSGAPRADLDAPDFHERSRSPKSALGAGLV